MEALKIVPCYNDNYKEMRTQAKKEGHLVCSLSYLHGNLEEDYGYDIAICLNAELCYNGSEIIEGIYEVQAIDYPNPCTAYLWKGHFNRERGLIVDNTDSESVSYAKECYKTKKAYL